MGWTARVAAQGSEEGSNVPKINIHNHVEQLWHCAALPLVCLLLLLLLLLPTTIVRMQVARTHPAWRRQPELFFAPRAHAIGRNKIK